MDNRAQGRPRENFSVGKAKILARLRDKLRFARSFDTSRKGLAHSASVTPALISYYFPKHEDVLGAVVTPIVEGYLNEMKSIIDGPHDAASKLKMLIKHLRRLYIEDGLALQLYNNLAATEPNYVDEMTAHLTKFFSDLSSNVDAAQDPSFEAAVFQGAVRGMCEFNSKVTQAVPDDEMAEKMERALSILARQSSVALTPRVVT